MCGKTKKGRTISETIHEMEGLASIEDNLRESKLKWFDHIQRGVEE